MSQGIHLIFVHLAKAYDSVLICKLFEILKQSNINITFVQAIRLLHTGSTARKTRLKLAICTGIHSTQMHSSQT